MKGITDLFAHLGEVNRSTVDTEVAASNSVKADIMADAEADVASVYTGYTAQYAALKPEPNRPVCTGSLAPGQVIPMWDRYSAGGEHRAWRQVTALQLMSWSAVSYAGSIWMANTEPDAQGFRVDADMETLEINFSSGRDRLLAPGGRVMTNVFEGFPCAVPFQHTPPRALRPRAVNAMSPCAWWRIFHQAEVLTAVRPSWQLVELVDIKENASDPVAPGNDTLYDPVGKAYMEVRSLELPVGLEWAELILDNVECAPRTLREVIHQATEDYLAKQGNPKFVGFAWFDDEAVTPEGEMLDATAVHSIADTRQFVFKTKLDERNKHDFRRLNSGVILQRMQNGVYDRDLA